MRRVGTLAQEYAALRREDLLSPRKASHCLQWARERLAAHGLYMRAEEIGRYQSSFCNQEGADVYTLASLKGRLRVEIAFIPDDHGESDDFESDDYAGLLKYFRRDAKLGRHASHLAALRALANAKEAKDSDREIHTYGISVNVFWNTPQLESGDPIGESSCWGFTSDFSNDSRDYQWSCALDQYREAMHGICCEIRSRRKAERKALMIEAFQANFSI